MASEAVAPIAPFDAAADRPEAGNPRDGLALRDPPGRAAPDQQAAERDDEGRHAEIGDDGTLRAADQRADGDRRQHRDEPGQRMLEPPDRRKPLRLHDADHHADEAEHGADRQVDVAGDDDEHHPAGHDRDRGGLHREVPEIARREETPPESRWKPVQIAASATSMPTRRGGISSVRRSEVMAGERAADPMRGLRRGCVFSCRPRRGRQARPGKRPPSAPTGVDHHVQVLARDRHGLEEDRGHVGLARPWVPLHGARHLGELGPARQANGDLGGVAAELARILPDRHGLLPSATR